MNTNRYYFPDIIEDDTLSIIAVQAKELLQQNDNIVKIFQVNNELIYGHSPRQILYLMRQNNKSIFSSTSSSKINLNDEKSNRGLATPVTRNRDVSNFPRKYLQLDVEKSDYSATSEPSTPVRRQKIIVSPEDKAILNKTIDENVTSDEQFTSPIRPPSDLEADKEESPRSAEITKMTANLTMGEKELGSIAKVTGSMSASNQESTPSITPVRHKTVMASSTDKDILISPNESTSNRKADNKESPRSSEIANMTANLTMVDKELGSPAKTDNSMGESSQKSPRSTEVSIMSSSLLMDEKELGNSGKVIVTINLKDQESPQSTKINRVTSSTVDDIKFRSLIQDNKIAGNLTINTDSCNSEEKTAKFNSPGSIKKDSTAHAEDMVTISKPTIVKSDNHSPAKITKMSSKSAFDIQEYASLAEKERIADSSPKATDEIASRIQGDKVNVSPNEASTGIVRGERKRKSLSPRKEKTRLFRSIPRDFELPEKAEIDIEIPCDFGDSAEPTSSRSLSVCRSNLTKDHGENPVLDVSKTETSPKSIGMHLNPSERQLTHDSVCGTNSPGSDEVVFGGKDSDYPSIDITRERSESRSADIENDPLSLNYKVRNFNDLLSIRNVVVKKIFYSLLSFQTGIQFLSSYVYNVANTVLLIGVSDNEYLTKDLKDTINDACALALKLNNKLKSWKTDVDLDINTWNKCFQQIEQLKAQYEPLLTHERQPAVTFEVAQVYEFEMKAIWKIMDDMIMMGDSRRALFSHIDHDVKKLMKMFVECLVSVGILHSR